MYKTLTKIFIGGLSVIMMAATNLSGPVMAEEIPNGISVSPSSGKIVLSPGDSYTGTVTVSNPSTAGQSISYDAHTDSFFVDNEYSVTLGTENDYTKMKDWMSLENASGTLQAGESAEIKYTISVPDSAPAGGQYAAVVVATTPAEGGSGATIHEIWQIASTIYASVSGASTLSGNIKENNIPSFVLNPPLEASFVVENTGNVHADATYYMQVFPLFSGEEVYTNEENPGVSNVMPGTTRAIVNTWNDAPQVGVFRVIQTIKAFGGESTVERIVILCPIWLLFIIFFIIAAIIIWIVMRVRGRNKASKRASVSKSE